jgi:preprotein translocase subunit YajC
MDGLGMPLVLAQEGSGKPTRGAGGEAGGLIFPIVLAFVFVYFFLIRPQKREQEAKQNLLSAIKKNDRVVTTGGMFGTIVNIKDDEVTLRVDDQNKVKIRFSKSAIARVVTDSGSPAGDGSKKG